MYWTKRMADHPQAPKDVTYGIKQQKGKCYICGQNLTIEDSLEIHHRDGNRENNTKTNKAIVHNYCHRSHHRMAVSQKGILDVA
jgi:RNA-directed DNA polymerase